MHDKPTHRSTGDTNLPPVNPLKLLSPAEFAALGVHSVVFARAIDASDLSDLLPQAEVHPDAGALILLMSADGTPIMVTDSRDALDDWLQEQPVSLAAVH